MSEIEELQNKVLIGIGRNVLNLAKMEGILKSIVLSVKSESPLTDPEKATRKKKKEISKKSMGRLVDDFVRSVHPDRGRGDDRSDQVEQATVSVSLKFEDGDFVKEIEQSLRMVVEERNELIHKKLISFDPKSSDSCRSLIKELEDQRQRIKPRFEMLAAMRSAVREHQKELMDYINSARFDADFNDARVRDKEINH